MEYMILADGSLRLSPVINRVDDVLDALADYNGVAYYWYNLAFGWSRITNATDKTHNLQIDESEVPEVVLLAHMLE